MAKPCPATCTNVPSHLSSFAPGSSKLPTLSCRSTVSRRSERTRSRRRARLPSMSTRPLAITITRRHSASMSSISCVVRITVTPRSRLSLSTKSRTASFDTASSPIVGSSRNTRRGAWPSSHPAEGVSTRLSRSVRLTRSGCANTVRHRVACAGDRSRGSAEHALHPLMVRESNEMTARGLSGGNPDFGSVDTPGVWV